MKKRGTEWRDNGLAHTTSTGLEAMSIWLGAAPFIDLIIFVELESNSQ
jgi:hypothetical protein